MLNFDEGRFLRIQSGAVALAADIHETIARSLRDGAKNLFFLGSGGAGILMMPAARLLQLSSTFPVHLEMPAEIVVTGSAHLGPQSLVVIPSLSGTTEDSVEALAYCKERGATVITLTGHADTPLAREADVNFTNYAADDTSSESFYLQSFLLSLSVVHCRGEYDDSLRVFEELQVLPEGLLEAKRGFEAHAEELAQKLQKEPYHIISGAGLTWPEALYYGMCILEEMQWIRTRPVHASDFFHGTLELVEPDVSVILLKGEDASRPLVERVERFAARYTKKQTVLDTARFPLPGVSKTVRALIPQVVLATLLERLSAHLEVKRNHPLTTRRYYRRVEY